MRHLRQPRQPPGDPQRFEVTAEQVKDKALPIIADKELDYDPIYVTVRRVAMVFRKMRLNRAR